LISQIAAGEVIERPASVVKELVENSIDAGSKRIEIDLEQGGTELIRIVDDGHGIAPDDLALAFASHATSKLKEADDLFRIHTLGFRGEALASIGGVARVTLQSRPPELPLGGEIECNGGQLSPMRSWSGMPGTRIEARHLFFNVPVRKKFLKSISTEVGHVTEMVTRLSLSVPNLHLVLRHNQKLVHEIPGSTTLEERIGLFFGKEIRDRLYRVEYTQGSSQITGYIVDPSQDRGNAKLQYLFVNGRWIRDRSLGAGIQEAYRGLLMTGRYAIAFLFLQVPPDEVDVNVHPTKSEVRFRDSQSMFHLVRSGVRRRLSQQNLIPHLQVPVEQKSEPEPTRFEQPEPPPVSEPVLFRESPRRNEAIYTPAPWERPQPSPVPPPSAVPVPVPTPPVAPPEPIAKAPEPAPEPIEEPREVPIPRGLIKAIQIHDSYLVIETPEGMLVVDQHALHERILFEQLQQRIRTGQLDVQRLLIPEPIDLPSDQVGLILDAKEELLRLGLEVEDFGGGTVLLSSYPVLLGRISPAKIFKSVVDHLVSQDRPPSREVLFNHLLATMACKAAVKAGDRLTPEEIAYLMELRQLAEDSHHCPHGRPTSLLFSRQELDKQFRRI
jgi:DNA mismatch repair protein MutL